MPGSLIRFYARGLAIRTARDAYLIASILTLAGCRWLDRHKL